MSKTFLSEIKVSNYNRSCDCNLNCKKLIEKNSQYYYIIEAKHKFAIHLDCHDAFVIWLEKS